MIVQLIDFTALFLLMLVTGIFWGPWFSLHRSLNRFSKGEFLKIVNTLVNNLAVPMRFLMPACIVLLGLSTWFYPEKASVGFYFCLVSLLLTLFSLYVTIIAEVPLVGLMKGWTEHSMPFKWEKIRDNWLRFHVIRTFSSVTSFACLVVSIVIQ